MLKSVLFFVAIAVFSGCVKAQQLSNGTCPPVDVMPNFDVNKFLKRWYVVRVNSPEQPDYKCLTGYYKLNGDDVRVQNKRINNCLLCLDEDKSPTLSYDAKIQSSGSWTLTPAQSTFPYNHPDTPNFQVLDTDYDNYAVIYVCFDNMDDGTKYQTYWILTRSKQPSTDVLDTALAVLTANNLDANDLMEISQKLCPPFYQSIG